MARGLINPRNPIETELGVWFAFLRDTVRNSMGLVAAEVWQDVDEGEGVQLRRVAYYTDPQYGGPSPAPHIPRRQKETEHDNGDLLLLFARKTADRQLTHPRSEHRLLPHDGHARRCPRGKGRLARQCRKVSPQPLRSMAQAKVAHQLGCLPAAYPAEAGNARER